MSHDSAHPIKFSCHMSFSYTLSVKMSVKCGFLPDSQQLIKEVGDAST